LIPTTQPFTETNRLNYARKEQSSYAIATVSLETEQMNYGNVTPDNIHNNEYDQLKPKIF